MRDGNVDAISFDVSRLVERHVANLYSHLVTRPTGRAVRFAIETQLRESPGLSVSLIDLSQVAVLDFSCADEVVAKLLLPGEEGVDAHFVFRGVGDLHLDPIQAVLQRHRLRAVAEVQRGQFQLLGTPSPAERRVWSDLERRRAVSRDEVERAFPDPGDQDVLRQLADRRLALRHPVLGGYHALSGFVEDDQ